MADPIPEGYITLKEAYDAFNTSKWGGVAPHEAFCAFKNRDQPHFNARIDAIENAERYEFIRLLRNKALEAFWRPIGSDENKRVLPGNWDPDRLADLLVYKEQVHFVDDDVWRPMIGRTLFIDEVKFQDWLNAYLTDTDTRRSVARESLTLAREQILDSAAHGEIDPQRAEELCRLWRLVMPLATSPSPEDYDPMSEPHWSLPMSVGWIANSSPEGVRRFWNGYLKKCWEWRQVGKGWQLTQPDLVSFQHLKLEAKFNEALNDAVGQLILSLKNGELAAFGTLVETGRTEDIRQEEWSNPKLPYIFDGIRLPSICVVAVWPADNGKIEVEHHLNAVQRKPAWGTVDDGIAYLEEQDRQFLAGKRDRISHALWAKDGIAKKEFGLSYHQACQAWSGARLSQGFARRRTKREAAKANS